MMFRLLSALLGQSLNFFTEVAEYDFIACMLYQKAHGIMQVPKKPVKYRSVRLETALKLLSGLLARMGCDGHLKSGEDCPDCMYRIQKCRINLRFVWKGHRKSAAEIFA
jgi:hypothetical protein